ncbi:MAG: galactitol-1-phosphate 5-dehydrogenase [Candidatus Omnitrophica bacterium]|nr:galactitol-1-phosphate 5-dehydrogenase [Candidatus Omnitrophota bacterium]
MKALVLEENGVLRYRDVADPVIGRDECLVRIKAAGICSSDIHRAFESGAYHYPLIMGHELSGVVETVGPDVRQFKSGDRVAVFPLLPCFECEFCRREFYAQCMKYDYYGSRRDGGFADFLAVPEWNLFPVPDEVDLAAAALLEPFSVGVHAARKITVQAGQTVAVLGAGIIGLMVSRFLAATVQPDQIFVLDRNVLKLRIAADFGCQTVLILPGLDWKKEFIKQTGGVDHVIETCGAAEVYRATVDLAKHHGNVVWAGNIDGDLHWGRQTVSSVIRKELKIYGCWNAWYTHKNDDDWHAALEFIRQYSGCQDWITQKYPLAQGVEVLQKLRNYKLPQQRLPGETIIKTIFVEEKETGC